MPYLSPHALKRLPGLTAGPLVLAAYLAARSQGGKRVCTLWARHIASDLGLTVETARAHFRALADAGILFRRWLPGGRRMTILNWDYLTTGDPAALWHRGKPAPKPEPD